MTLRYPFGILSSLPREARRRLVRTLHDAHAGRALSEWDALQAESHAAIEASIADWAKPDADAPDGD